MNVGSGSFFKDVSHAQAWKLPVYRQAGRFTLSRSRLREAGSVFLRLRSLDPF
jgi:hypothetical protein